MAEEIKMLLDYHGFDETLTIATEECAELIKEITKYKRAKITVNRLEEEALYWKKSQMFLFVLI